MQNSRLSGHRRSRTFVATLVGSSLVLQVPVPTQAAEAGGDLGSRFTLGVLPDTQFYSRYGTEETGNLYEQRYGSQPFESQAQFIVDNQDELNIPFTTHLGDVVDQSYVTPEWGVADRAMKIMEDGGANYSILPGNHDLGGGEEPVSPFSKTFSAERAAQNETFQERQDRYNQESEYHIFEAEGQKYLVLALAWRADDETLAWAQNVLDAHKDLPTILTSHEVTNIDADGDVFLSESYGRKLFSQLVAPNDQVFMTLGGHHHGAGYVIEQNNAGHDVVNVLQDYQMAYQGGNGLLGLIEFDLTGNELDMTALSPWVAEKPQESLNQFDHLIPDGKTDSWTIPFSFEERFEGFAPEWKAGDADDPDYSALAREIVSTGYVPPTIESGQLPVDEQDYPKVDNTAAHWRPGQATADGKRLTDGDTAGVGTVIPDVSGRGNDMTRAELNTRGASGAQEDDVTYSDDTHELSSDAGSLNWRNVDSESKRLNWFETAADAVVNEETFEDGYTFETFIRIDDSFDGDNHWMGAIAREGSRGEIGVEAEASEPPATLAVSSLRELQWSAVATEGQTEGASNWSHEVPKDEWLHVAIVNDPEENTVEMFVNGAPILRDVLDASGLATAKDPWLMGATMWAGDPANPWNGSIGETRITHGALAPDQWLTARTHDGSGDNGSSGSSGSSFGGGVLVAVLGLAAALGGALALNPALLNQVRAQLEKFGIRF